MNNVKPSVDNTKEVTHFLSCWITFSSYLNWFYVVCHWTAICRHKFLSDLVHPYCRKNVIYCDRFTDVCTINSKMRIRYMMKNRVTYFACSLRTVQWADISRGMDSNLPNLWKDKGNRMIYFCSNLFAVVRLFY